MSQPFEEFNAICKLGQPHDAETLFDLCSAVLAKRSATNIEAMR